MLRLCRRSHSVPAAFGPAFDLLATVAAAALHASAAAIAATHATRAATPDASDMYTDRQRRHRRLL